MNKGQVSFEFGLAFIIILLFFTFSYTVYFEKTIKFERESEIFERHQKCLRVAKIIDAVYNSGPGTDWNGFFDDNVIIIGDSHIIVGDLNLSVDLVSKGAVTKFDGNVAYYSCGSEPRNLFPFMYARGADIYYNSTCGLADDTNLNSLLNSLSLYQVIFLEDPKMKFPDYTHSFDNWVDSGGRLVMTEYMYDHENGPFMDRTWKRNEADTNCPATVVGTHEDFPFTLGQAIVYKKCPTVVAWKDVNALVEFDDAPPNRAGGLWFNYGSGDAFYFADLDANVLNTDWNFADLVSSFVSQDVNQIILGSGYGVCEHMSVVSTVKLLNDEVVVRNVGGVVVASNK